MHFLGGAAAAYFIAHALLEWEEFFGRPSPWGRRLVVFALATTVAVFWEFLEFTAGASLGLYSQLSLGETMGDLLFGCAGAAGGIRGCTPATGPCSGCSRSTWRPLS